MRRHDQRGDVSFVKPSGRKVSVCTTEMFERVASLFKENPELSCREAAKQLGVARTTIFRIIAKMREKNLETYKVIESEPRCPTCHQKIDPKVLAAREKRKSNQVKIKKESAEKKEPAKRKETVDEGKNRKTMEETNSENTS